MSTIRTDRRPTPFLLWIWAMLFVVLLSAAPTGGAPRTQVVGSAFDPATVSVALSPKQPKTKAAIEAAKGNLPDKFLGSPPALTPTADAIAEHRSLEGIALHHAVSAALDSPRALVRAHGPRAPPTV